MFILGNAAVVTTAIAVGVSVACIIAIVIIISVVVLIYCYKVKNRYNRYTESFSNFGCTLIMCIVIEFRFSSLEFVWMSPFTVDFGRYHYLNKDFQ